MFLRSLHSTLVLLHGVFGRRSSSHHLIGRLVIIMDWRIPGKSIRSCRFLIHWKFKKISWESIWYYLEAQCVSLAWAGLSATDSKVSRCLRRTDAQARMSSVRAFSRASFLDVKNQTLIEGVDENKISSDVWFKISMWMYWMHSDCTLRFWHTTVFQFDFPTVLLSKQASNIFDRLQEWTRPGQWQ